MGINNSDNTVQTLFYPDQVVDKAQFATMLSRVLYGNKYNGAEESWFQKHVEVLSQYGIVRVEKDVFSPLLR